MMSRITLSLRKMRGRSIQFVDLSDSDGQKLGANIGVSMTQFEQQVISEALVSATDVSRNSDVGRWSDVNGPVAGPSSLVAAG
jgi:hypothetical protein